MEFTKTMSLDLTITGYEPHPRYTGIIINIKLHDPIINEQKEELTEFKVDIIDVSNPITYEGLFNNNYSSIYFEDYPTLVFLFNNEKVFFEDFLFPNILKYAKKHNVPFFFIHEEDSYNYYNEVFENISKNIYSGEIEDSDDEWDSYLIKWEYKNGNFSIENKYISLCENISLEKILDQDDNTLLLLFILYIQVWNTTIHGKFIWE